jgi:mannose-6-phosphate isomerase-like protein (cupin superfamily)
MKEGHKNMNTNQLRNACVQSKSMISAARGRRTFLGAGLASLPLSLFGQTARTVPAAQPGLVSAGADRFGEHHTIGISSTSFKVATADSHRDLFIMEHSNSKKGGVPRHLHHHEDEWFYVLEGEYVAEIGDKRVRLKPGDSILGPREVPHAWAFAGETPGRLLIAFTPANKMEEYFRVIEKLGRRNSWDNPQDRERMRAFGMELLGPPLSIE